MKGKKKTVAGNKLVTFRFYAPPIKYRGHEGELNETAKAHFLPPEDIAHAAQSAWHLPRAYSFFHLQIINQMVNYISTLKQTNNYKKKKKIKNVNTPISIA
jgi:hypothetical protein